MLEPAIQRHGTQNHKGQLIRRIRPSPEEREIRKESDIID